MFALRRKGRDEHDAVERRGSEATDGPRDDQEDVQAVVAPPRGLPRMTRSPSLVALLPPTPPVVVRSERADSVGIDYMAEFQKLQRFVADLLEVHVLSPAITYDVHEPLRVNALQWWNEVRLQSVASVVRRGSRKRRLATVLSATGDANSLIEALILDNPGVPTDDLLEMLRDQVHGFQVAALFQVLRTLTKWTDQMQTQNTRDHSRSLRYQRNQVSVLQSVQEAIGVVGAKLLVEWSRSIAHSTVCFGVEVVSLLLQFCDEVGTFHPFHEHKLIASAAMRVFRHQQKWKCSRCKRSWETRGSAVPFMVFHCAACSYSLCRECYTRIPNDSRELDSIRQHQDAFKQKLTVSGFISLVLPKLRENEPSCTLIVPRFAVAARARIQDLPLYRSQEMVPMMQMLVDMMEVRGMPRVIIDHAFIRWIPLYISGGKMRIHSFLGPIMWWTSMSDEPGEINLTPEGSHRSSSTALTLQWNDGYSTMKQLLNRLFTTLLSDSQDPYVVDATVCWIATTVAAMKSRRQGNYEDVDRFDGLLINLSIALVHIIKPIMDQSEKTIDATYHMHANISPRRACSKREEPLRTSSEREKPFDGVARMRQRDAARLMDPDAKSAATTDFFYPVAERHFGVQCDHCRSADFDGVRYKCSQCEDVDICGHCFETFCTQSESAGSDSSRLRGGGRVHTPHHVFLRVHTPVPLVVFRHFVPITAPQDSFRRVEDEHCRPPISEVVTCAECKCSLDDVHVYHKCSNCIDARFVCSDCLGAEEAPNTPNAMHLPGHIYFEITHRWQHEFTPFASALHFDSLLYPASVYPRERFGKETEIFHVLIKCLHIGPLFSLSRHIGNLKEMQELQAFCLCEEERVEYERRQSRARGRRRGNRSTPKLSPHYNASKARLGDLAASRLMAEMHLVDSRNVMEWLSFYSLACRWLLGLMSPSQDPWTEVVSDFGHPFSSFPEHFFFDLCDMVYLLSLESVDYQHATAAVDGPLEGIVEPLLVMLLQLVVSRQCTKNPHLRVQAAKAMNVLFAFFAKSKDNSVISDVISRCNVLRRFSVFAVLRFHEDMEAYHVRNNGLVFNSNVGSGDHLLWGFLSIRVTVVQMLRYLWQVEEQQKVIVSAFEEKSRAFGFTASTSEDHTMQQVSMVLSGMWSDAAKLVEESNAKIALLRQLAEIQEAIQDGHQVSLPFRLSMMESYIALHSKHLRLAMRSLVEVLEMLSWIAQHALLRRTLLKPELVDQGVRTVSFLASSISTAHQSKSWSIAWHLREDNRIMLANLVMLVVRCAGAADACTTSSFWKLIQHSGTTTMSYIGDFEAHARWTINGTLARIEAASYLAGRDFSDETLGEASAVDDDLTVSDTSSMEDMDENDALALLEHHAAHAVSLASRKNQAQVVSKQLGKRFISALAKDGRFDYDKFVASCEMLHRATGNESSDEAVEYELVDVSWIKAFKDAMTRCRSMIQLHASMDELLSDAPEDYLDPLLNTIMTDPVRLPSGNIVDRSVIERHLLSSQRVDPFTREPLTSEMLQPCDSLRQEIQMYLRAKLKHLDHAKEDVLATWGLAWNCIFDVDAADKEVTSELSEE
ncbi:hypothetical protein Poli38472_004698 [Pythium oligandrum]|uniref:RING-type E3 ubiquitin transferase n=1 Tax=Pythium oligandrum TaxID=41045 RepID=A0A8K1CAT0_PYTOL|nr:hypothetical protein Poli38472_004698 [Pythium oligandrum]|eukprot:TMW59629.1 hypothetical protein Poli38472_004698 [Pythium oligandrum]